MTLKAETNPVETSEQTSLMETRRPGPDGNALSKSHMSEATNSSYFHTRQSSDGSIEATIIDQDEDDAYSLLSDSSTLYDGDDDTSDFTIYEDDDTVTLAEGNNNNDSLTVDKKRTIILTKDKFLYTRIKFVGINVKHNKSNNKPSVISTILSVRSIVRETRDDLINNRSREHWKIEKTLEDFLTLDMHLRESGFDGPPLPQTNILTSNAPTKVATRRLMLEQYMRQAIKSARKNDDAASYLAVFLSSDLFDNSSKKKSQWLDRKEGVLTKKGKLFGGWKSRYFVLDGTRLEYFESKDGKLLGSIPLHKARIGSQVTHVPGTPITTDHLHALTVDAIQIKGITPQYARHALCANSDEERDEWVRAITKVVRSLDSNDAITGRKEHKTKQSKESQYVKFHRVSVAELKKMDTEEPSISQPMLFKLARGKNDKKP